MRIVSLSDTHGMWDQVTVPDGEVLVHAGDITRYGEIPEIEKFNAWLGTLPHRYKVVIAGNHDRAFEKDHETARSKVTNGIYLQDEEVIIEGIKFFGSPWQPRFHDWSFNLDRGEPIRKVWDQIPKDTEVLITHGPSFEGLDVRGGARGRVGCEDLQMVMQSLTNLKAHIFGHIHHSYGIVDRRGIIYANSCVCDEAYRPVNSPHVFDI